ncbi:MAG: glycosyltransferase [Planctomycetes bacterium]|nr:glycosyltransferase [Planctomycetota bacterium]
MNNITASSDLSLAIIIPVLNEMKLLPGCIALLHQLQNIDQIIFCDGGSDDGSQAYIRRSMPQATCIEITGGRHHQLNAALALTQSDIVWCCAVDLRFDLGLPESIKKAVVDGAAHGCCLQRSSRGGIHYRVQDRWAQHRASFCHAAYMDQAPFWRRDCLHAVGGFRDKGTYDTAELSRRIALQWPFTVVHKPVVSSCRAWQRGYWRQTLRNQGRRLRYLFDCF